MNLAFWTLAAFMLALALAVLLPVLLRSSDKLTAPANTDPKATNLQLARERLAELESERQRGNLNATEFEQARLDLEAMLLNDVNTAPNTTPTTTSAASGSAGKNNRWLAISLFLLVPAFTIALYFKIGSPDAVDGSLAARAPMAAGQMDGQQPSIEAMVEKLAARMQQDPDNGEGWFMLGRSYMALQRYPEAAAAFKELHRLAGDEPQVLVIYADALAMVNGGRMSGQPEQLIQRALEIEPENKTALWLAGIARAEQGDHQTAIQHWQRLSSLIQDDPDTLAEIQTLIQRSKQQLDPSAAQALADNSPPATAPAPPANAPATGATLKVEVTLDDSLRDQIDPDATLFIFARALEGPPMPLAVARKQARDLPITVTLDDSMAMMPAMQLSKFTEVRVGARISKSGNAMPQSGDYSGEVAPVKVGSTDVVQVKISEPIP